MSSAAEMEWTPTLQAILGAEPELQLYGEVSVWFHKLALFRKREQERIYLPNPTVEDMQIHKQLLFRLIADGEHLLRLVEGRKGLVQNPESIKAEDLAAAIEGLRDTYRGWHEPMPPDRQKKIIGDVFADVA